MPKPTRKQMSIHYRDTFSSESGRLVLADLIANNFLLAGLPPEDRAFCDGRRNVVLDILEMLSYRPEQVRSLIEEIEGRLGLNDEVNG
jgi:hypothetical protein